MNLHLCLKNASTAQVDYHSSTLYLVFSVSLTNNWKKNTLFVVEVTVDRTQVATI